MFSVIETVNEEGMKEVSVVCTKWIDGGQVAWPTNYRKAIKKQIDPSEDWQKYNCKILKQNMNFDEAKTKELYFSKFSSSECDESVYNPKKKFLIKNFNYQFDKSAATSTEHGNKENDSINLNSNINPIEILSIEKLPPITTSNYEQPNEVVNSKSDTVEIITHSEGDSFFLTDHNLCTPVFRANSFIETGNHINTDIVETGNENTNEETPAVSNIVFQSQNGNFQSEYSIQRPLENAEVSHINFKLEKTLKKVNDVKEKVKQNKIAIKGVQTDILTIRENQKKIIDNQADIMECLQLIIKGLPKQTQAPIILDQNFIVPHLPITTVENLTKLNSKLSNKHYMDQMTIYLYKHKTNNINKTVKNLFEQLFVYDLVIKYSWSGQTSFAKDIHQLVFAEQSNILELFRNIFNYLNSDNVITMDNVKSSVQEFLKRASFRHKIKEIK